MGAWSCGARTARGWTNDPPPAGQHHVLDLAGPPRGAVEDGMRLIPSSAARCVVTALGLVLVLVAMIVTRERR